MAPPPDHLYPVYFREWRQWAGLSQRQLGLLTGLTKPSISRIETGQRDWTGVFLRDFQIATGCPHVASPLKGPPPPDYPRSPQLSEAEVDARRFETARDRKRKARAAHDEAAGKAAPPLESSTLPHPPFPRVWIWAGDGPTLF